MTFKNFESIMEQIDSLLDLIKTVQKQKHKKYASDTLIPHDVGCDMFILKIMSLVKKQDKKLFNLASSLLKDSATVADVMDLKIGLAEYIPYGIDNVSDESLVYGKFASEKELKAYNVFCRKHTHQKEKVASGKYNVAGWTDEVCYIKPIVTGVGMIRIAVCPFCGKEKDITDIDTW